jgi:hypothetical protein
MKEKSFIKLAPDCGNNSGKVFEVKKSIKLKVNISLLRISYGGAATLGLMTLSITTFCIWRPRAVV